MSIETYQQAVVSSVILKYLMGLGQAGLFVNSEEPQELAQYRATTFFPDANGRELVPCYRARFGGEVKRVQSSVRFRRDEGFAGIAWNNPGRMLMRLDLKTINDFGEDLAQWRNYWTVLISAKGVVDAMGQSSPYIRNTRSILAFCIEVVGCFTCVVCIDSLLPNGFEDQYIRRIYHPSDGGAGQAIRTGLLWVKELAGHARVPLLPLAEVNWQMPISVFISHAKADEQLVSFVVNYLERCFVIPDGSLRCTSIDGYELEVGSRTSEVLRQELGAADVVLGIITKHSLESGYVLMELGAAWGSGKTVCCLLGDGVDYKDIPGPLVESHAERLKDGGAMANLLGVIAAKTNWQKKNTRHRISAQKTFDNSLATLERTVQKHTHPKTSAHTQTLSARDGASHPHGVSSGQRRAKKPKNTLKTSAPVRSPKPKGDSKGKRPLKKRRH